MHRRSSASSLLVYFGAVAAALSVTTLGVMAVVKSSMVLSHSAAREKTLLELQVESSRQIRQALGTPVVVPPLPPITARPTHNLMDEKKLVRPKLPQAAMDAMAMDRSGAYGPSGTNYAVRDRHTSY